jgi:hypothetical protein
VPAVVIFTRSPRLKPVDEVTRMFEVEALPPPTAVERRRSHRLRAAFSRYAVLFATGYLLT